MPARHRRWKAVRGTRIRWPADRRKSPDPGLTRNMDAPPSARHGRRRRPSTSPRGGGWGRARPPERGPGRRARPGSPPWPWGSSGCAARIPGTPSRGAGPARGGARGIPPPGPGWRGWSKSRPGPCLTTPVTGIRHIPMPGRPTFPRAPGTMRSSSAADSRPRNVPSEHGNRSPGSRAGMPSPDFMPGPMSPMRNPPGSGRRPRTFPVPASRGTAVSGPFRGEKARNRPFRWNPRQDNAGFNQMESMA